MIRTSTANSVTDSSGKAGMKNIWRIALQPALMMPTQRPHSEPAQIPNAARNWIAPTPSRNQPQVLRSVMT